jgi:hypothetical protein
MSQSALAWRSASPAGRVLLTAVLAAALWIGTPPTVAAQPDNLEMAVGQWEGYATTGDLVRVNNQALPDGTLASAIVMINARGDRVTQDFVFTVSAESDVAWLLRVVDAAEGVPPVRLVWYSQDAVRVHWPGQLTTVLARVINPETAATPGPPPQDELTISDPPRPGPPTASGPPFSDDAQATIRALAGRWRGSHETLGPVHLDFTVNNPVAGQVTVINPLEPRTGPISLQVIDVSGASLRIRAADEPDEDAVTIEILDDGALRFRAPDLPPVLLRPAE